jgi:hypothetical protein
MLSLSTGPPAVVCPDGMIENGIINLGPNIWFSVSRYVFFAIRELSVTKRPGDDTVRSSWIEERSVSGDRAGNERSD